jgi:hypothetical protein
VFGGGRGEGRPRRRHLLFQKRLTGRRIQKPGSIRQSTALLEGDSQARERLFFTWHGGVCARTICSGKREGVQNRVGVSVFMHGVVPTKRWVAAKYHSCVCPSSPKRFFCIHFRPKSRVLAVHGRSPCDGTPHCLFQHSSARHSILHLTTQTENLISCRVDPPEHIRKRSSPGHPHHHPTHTSK